MNNKRGSFGFPVFLLAATGCLSASGIRLSPDLLPASRAA